MDECGHVRRDDGRVRGDAAPGKGPGLLLLLQEIFGVNAHIRGVAEQYALAGFTVIAPDLFWRQGKRIELGYVGDDRERAMTSAALALGRGLVFASRLF